ncbi:hypothetical protein [Deinococcus sp.]|uniref:hypothetical protein n=1 Tax=Deinococcus sp. TaxID=47478 RepID=UPI003B59F0ED
MSEQKKVKPLWLPSAAKEAEGTPLSRRKYGWLWWWIIVPFAISISFDTVFLQVSYSLMWMILTHDSRLLIWLLQREGMQPTERIRKLSILSLGCVFTTSFALLALALLGIEASLSHIALWTFSTPIVALCLIIDSMRQRRQPQGPSPTPQA